MNKLHHKSKQRSIENKIFPLVSSFLKFEFYKFSYVDHIIRSIFRYSFKI